MTNEEIGQLLSKIDKKMDKILNLQTKIAKVLHLLPVTEKEEKELQLLQRKNLATAAKVNDDLDAMENKGEPSHDLSNVFAALENATTIEIYDDVIGSDIFGN